VLVKPDDPDVMVPEDPPDVQYRRCECVQTVTQVGRVLSEDGWVELLAQGFRSFQRPHSDLQHGAIAPPAASCPWKRVSRRHSRWSPLAKRTPHYNFMSVCSYRHMVGHT
jgi:hypothetical protein